jgi:hypothetical protein
MKTKLMLLVAVSMLTGNNVCHANQESDEVVKKKVRVSQDSALIQLAARGAWREKQRQDHVWYRLMKLKKPDDKSSQSAITYGVQDGHIGITLRF